MMVLKNDAGSIKNLLRDGLMAMDEEAWTSWVIAESQAAGWMAFHARHAKTEKGWRTLTQGDRGFFDLVLCRGGVTILAELKSQVGKLSPPQRAWAAAATPDGLAGGEGARVFVWRPEDWERVKEALQ